LHLLQDGKTAVDFASDAETKEFLSSENSKPKRHPGKSATIPLFSATNFSSAVQACDVSAVESFLRAGADVNMRDSVRSFDGKKAHELTLRTRMVHSLCTWRSY